MEEYYDFFDQEKEYYWYDYETTGTRWFNDRVVQFGGLRTDENLEPVDEPQLLYCKPQIDCLPQVKGWLTHGISIEEAEDNGSTEFELASRIHRLLTVPNTRAVAFNGLRFDHVITRVLFYRNLLDPFEWHGEYALGNAKWDTLALFFAVHALGPNGIRFTEEDPEKGPSFTQANLARLNNKLMGESHNALGDVRTMVALARLVQEKHPGLYEYYLTMTDRTKVHRCVTGTFVYVSGAFRKRPKKAGVMQRVEIDRTGNVFAFDLSVDPDDALEGKVLWDGSEAQNAIRRFRLNGAPFVVPINLDSPLGPDQEAWLERLDLDIAVLKDHRAKLRRLIGGRKNRRRFLNNVWPNRHFSRRGEQDVDERLYDGLIEWRDRNTLRHILADTENPSAKWDHLYFEDDRLPELVFRFRARNFPESLSVAETQRWHAHIRTKLFEKPDEEGRTEYERFTSEIAEHRLELADNKSKLNLLDELEHFGAELKSKVSVK